MPKFLFTMEYSREALAGVMEQGATARREAVDTLIGSVGGQVESLHWSPEGAAYLIATLPEQRAAATVSFVVLSAGAAKSVRVVDLLTADEIDAAAKASVDFRPPR